MSSKVRHRDLHRLFCVALLAYSRDEYDPQLPFPCSARPNEQGIPNAWCTGKRQRGEVALNQQVKDLIQKLGEAIHESVSESEAIADVVREIRDQGFDVLLMLEATIGLNEVDGQEEGDRDAETDPGHEVVEGSFTRNDLSFLRSLRISTEEHPA